MMNKLFSLLMISAALCATAGCGKKKQVKATAQTTVVADAQVLTSSSKDSKEDYTITA